MWALVLQIIFNPARVLTTFRIIDIYTLQNTYDVRGAFFIIVYTLSIISIDDEAATVVGACVSLDGFLWIRNKRQPVYTGWLIITDSNCYTGA